MSNLSKSEHDELCCIYAGLLLWDDKVDITADRLNKVITASGNKVEGYYPEFFAKYLAEEDIEKLLTNVGGAAVAAQVAEVAPAKEVKKEEKKKKEEPKEEEEEEGGFMDLFG